MTSGNKIVVNIKFEDLPEEIKESYMWGIGGKPSDSELDKMKSNLPLWFELDMAGKKSTYRLNQFNGLYVPPETTRIRTGKGGVGLLYYHCRGWLHFTDCLPEFDPKNGQDDRINPLIDLGLRLTSFTFLFDTPTGLEKLIPINPKYGE